MSCRDTMDVHLDRIRDFTHIVRRLKHASPEQSPQEIELVRCFRRLSQMVKRNEHSTDTEKEYRSVYERLLGELPGHSSEHDVRRIGGQRVRTSSKRKSVSRSRSTHKSVTRSGSAHVPPSRKPSPRARSSHSRKALPKASSKTILQRAWQALLYSLYALQGVMVRSATTFVAVLKYAVSLFFSALRMAVQVAFAPVRWIGSLLKAGTRTAFKKAIYYWQSCMGVLLMVLTMIFSTDLYTLVHDVCLKNGRLNEDALKRIRHKIDAIWITACKPLASFVAVGIPQLTYDILRVWHMLLLDGSAAACSAAIGSIQYVEGIIGTEWMTSVCGSLKTNTNVQTWYKKIVRDRTTHRNDPLVMAYVNACKTFPKRVSSKTLQSFEWNAQASRTWQYFLKRYAHGAVESAEDVRHAKLNRIALPKPKLGLDKQWKRVMEKLPDNSGGFRSHHMAALQKGMSNVHRWVSGSANNLTVYHLMCGYFMLVSQGPGCLEGVRDSLVAIKNAKTVAAIGAAYEILGVSERLD